MKKRIIKILLSIITISIILSLSIVFATPFDQYSNASANTSDIEVLGGKVIGVINVAGTVIAICVLLFIGMKFMLAAPSERADLKGALVPYIVGAVLLFASVNIASIIYKFSNAYVK